MPGSFSGPSALSPWSNLDGARDRSHVVLQRMREQGFITGPSRTAARTARLRIRPYPASDRADNGYAKLFVRQQFRDVFGGDHPPDWKVITTINAALQNEAETAVRARLGPDRPPQSAGGARGACGRRAGKSWRWSGAATSRSRSSIARRAAGGSQGRRSSRSSTRRRSNAAITPVTLLISRSRSRSKGNGDWRPRNASTASLEPMPLREAFIESNNRAAVGVQQAIGSRRDSQSGRRSWARGFA